MKFLSVYYPFHFNPGGETLMKKFLSSLPAEARRDDSSMLLAGCGYGEAGFFASENFAGSVMATDEDAEGIFYAKMVAAALTPKNVQFRTMPALALRFDDASFNVVFLNGILNIYPKNKLLKEAGRLLKPGGMLAIADSYWLTEKVPHYARLAWESTRNKIFQKAELEILLAECGFQVKEFSDRSRELRTFYLQFKNDAKSITQSGFEGIKHLKSVVKKYKHEIDVYTKLGGDEHLGYFLLSATK